MSISLTGSGPSIELTGSGSSITLTVTTGGGSSGGVTDHGLLTGLSDDDHTQYHNDARGDARYLQQSNDLSDLASAAAARTNLGLGDSATLDVGTGSGDVAAGDAPASAVSTHNDATTSVHGIVDTSAIATGPASATDSAIALFDGTGGKTLKDSAVTISTDDTMASDSDAKVPTEQTVKAYVDNNAGGGDPTCAPNESPVWPVRSGRMFGIRRENTGTAAMAADYLRFIPFVPHADMTADRLVIYTTATVGGLCRLGIYLADGTDGLPSTLVVDSGEIDTSVASGDRLATISESLTAGTRYWLGSVFNTSTTVVHVLPGNYSYPGFGVGGISSDYGPRPFCYQAHTFGALPATASSLTWYGVSMPYVLVRAA